MTQGRNVLFWRWCNKERAGRCLIPGNIQGQVGQDSEQPALLENVPAHLKGLGLEDL